MTSTLNPAQSASHGGDNLALLYQGLLTSIVRVRSGSHPITNCIDFQKRIRDVLSGVEREAIRFGYPEKDVQDTNYAVVAFLDEAVLDSKDPSRHAWASLQEQLYGQAVAGERFFDQLKALNKRRDSPQLADILEVYYLCLLLGYQGKYGGYGDNQGSELRQVNEDLRARIESVRGSAMKFLVGEDAKPTAPPPLESGSNHWRLAAVVSFALLIAAWLVFRFGLAWIASSIRSGITT